jgi:hypothetical protein
MDAFIGCVLRHCAKEGIAHLCACIKSSAKCVAMAMAMACVCMWMDALLERMLGQTPKEGNASLCGVCHWAA